MHTLVLNSDAMPISLVPISTLHWEDAIKLVYKGEATVVEEHEDWEVHSPSVTMRVPSIVMTQKFTNIGRKVKFSKFNVYLRDHFTCQYCNEVFERNHLTLDHVIPKAAKGKTVWENVVASCSPCNFAKGHGMHMVPTHKPWRPNYYELVDRQRHYHITIPDIRWNFYLGWPEDKITVVKPKMHQVRQMAAIAVLDPKVFEHVSETPEEPKITAAIRQSARSRKKKP